jgi:aspartyl protease family protein
MSVENQSPLLLFLIFVLIVGVGSLLFGDFNNRFTRLFRQATVWTMIFLGTVLLFSFKDDIEDALLSRRNVVVEGSDIVLSRARDGHFYATLEINGADVEFIVDTGASQVVLTLEDATRAGLNPESLGFVGRAQTANGMVRTAPVTLEDVRLGERIDTNLRASVNQGALDTSLLGMTYLNRFQKIEIERNKLRLIP